jgi:hypothetical protein
MLKKEENFNMKTTDLTPYISEAKRIIAAHNSTNARKIGEKTLHRELKKVFPEASQRLAGNIIKLCRQGENIPEPDRSGQGLAATKAETKEKQLETEHLLFTDKKMPEMDIDKWFDMLITKRQLQNDLSCEQTEAIIELKNPLNLPYLIHQPFADLHLGDAACDIEGFRDLITNFKKCKDFLSIGGVGDYNNMFIAFKNAMALHSIAKIFPLWNSNCFSER